MSNRLSVLRRLTAHQVTLDAADMQDEVVAFDCTPLEDLRRGEMATVLGRLRSVIYTPRENVPTFTAELYDGSAAIDLVWLGRRRITGLEPGRRLAATGRVGVHDGHLAIYNPRYELRGVE